MLTLERSHVSRARGTMKRSVHNVISRASFASTKNLSHLISRRCRDLSERLFCLCSSKFAVAAALDYVKVKLRESRMAKRDDFILQGWAGRSFGRMHVQDASLVTNLVLDTESFSQRAPATSASSLSFKLQNVLREFVLTDVAFC